MNAVDVQRSEWGCTLEPEEDGSLSLRLGLRYAKGLRQGVAQEVVRTRLLYGSFRSTGDLAERVPGLNRKELIQLARIGALNWIGGVDHRRDAVWQVEEACREVGPLLRTGDSARMGAGPLRKMQMQERLQADYGGCGLTVGPHPMAYRRDALRRQCVSSAAELRLIQSGKYVRAAGIVIARQRPGTAMGFVFLSLEDETGISNIVIHPELYELERVVVTRGRFLLVEGKVQNQDGVVHLRADTVKMMDGQGLELVSHDFH